MEKKFYLKLEEIEVRLLTLLDIKLTCVNSFLLDDNYKAELALLWTKELRQITRLIYNSRLMRGMDFVSIESIVRNYQRLC